MEHLAEAPDTQEPATSSLLDRSLNWAARIDWEKVAYITFIAVALVTRLWALGTRVMSHDESLHTQFSLQYFRGDGYNHTPLMHGPFLFHITPVFYWLLGPSDFSARLPVALFGVALVAIPYFLRPWLGRIGALATSFFFLISPYITYYSRYIRHDIYVIMWAMIILIATWYYLRQPKEKYLWFFAGALALMYATKEVAFIYTAIFGSFLVLRLILRILPEPWFRPSLKRLRRPLLVLLAAVILFGIGFSGLRVVQDEASQPATTTTPEGDQGFAADPNETSAATPAATPGRLESTLRWVQVAGALLAGVALFLGVRELRPQLASYGEFDLIILYSTLVLPLISPFLAVLAGYNPTDYTISRCELAGQETMSAVQLLLARATNAVCLDAFFSSGIIRTGAFVVLTLAVAVAVGLWWNRRRWLIAAVIFHSIFLVLFTSVFTNPSGWASGIVGSLGYWLEQQDVQRGSQPWFYYFFVVPFYEFLPLVVSLLAIRLWAQRHRLSRIIGYWVPLLLVSLLAYSFSNWLLNRNVLLEGGEPNNLIALVIGLVFLAAGSLYWFLVYQQKVKDAYELGRGWSGLFRVEELVGFVPMLIWWLLLTWLAYSVAGEKMPWLSTHFVIPMALLSGWYLNETFSGYRLTSRRFLSYVGLLIVFLGAAFLALKPVFLGQISNTQRLTNLTAIGRFLGMVVIAVAIFYVLRRVETRIERPLRRRGWLLALLAALSVLTLRFTYMANWPNADSAREFLVYAHAAPAVKDVVMSQVDTLSQRLFGDKSMKVAWGDDGTWPIQWYLRDYPNRLYAGKNPSANITDYPVVIVGHRDLSAFENFLKERDYVTEDYTFLWWPIEDYRKFSWNALFGLGDVVREDGTARTGRGLLSADVRQALWDIFFYRDYTKYSEVFGGTHTASAWPLRADLRLFIRRDVLASLWDYGAGATVIEPPVDPYAAGELAMTPDLVIGAGGMSDGQLSRPRNLALGPDGNLYVLDSGNNRVAVFDSQGQLLRQWGSQGTAEGQFNEPWGIAVDDTYVYVADTWNHRVQKFTLDGDFVLAFGQSGSVNDIGSDSGGYFFGPRSVILMPDGQLLVTDTGNHRLQLFDRDGNFIRLTGQLGSEPGQFNEPVGLALSPDGWVYLADTWNARIQRFTLDLAPSLNWPIDGWEGDSTENKPYLAIDSAGRVYATDPENFRVLIFSAEGQYLARFGEPSSGIDGFGLPNGIAIANDDSVYVVDAQNNRVLRFPPLTLGATGPAGDASGEDSGGNDAGSPAEGGDGALPTAAGGDG